MAEHDGMDEEIAEQAPSTPSPMPIGSGCWRPTSSSANRSMVAHGRRIGGVPGAIVAGAMIAVRDIYEGPKRDDGSVVVDAPSEPHDVDRDGVTLTSEEIGGVHDLAVPAQPRREPVVGRRNSRRRR